MTARGVEYKGILLMPNSTAYDLWIRKEFKLLDRHMKELDQKEKDLMERYK